MRMNAEVKQAVITQFEQAMTYEDIKKAYVERATEFAGDKQATAFINKAFEQYVGAVKNKHVNKDGEEYTKEPVEKTEDFLTLIGELVSMQGITVESCGSWLWVSGETKAHKDALKNAGLRYAAKKNMWYKAPEGTKHYRGKKTWEMSKIRDVYGSEIIEDPEAIEQ